MKSALPFAVLAALSACSAQTMDGAHLAAPPAAARCVTLNWLEPGRPIVRATLNGRELTFVIDTGAEYDGWIKPEIARELKLPVVGEVPSDGPDDPTGGLPFYGVANFQLGSLDMGARRFAEFDQPGPKDQPFDGIIGSGMFEGLQAAFDYQRGVVQATDVDLTAGRVVPFEWGAPLITLDVGGTPAETIVDTGNLAAELFVTEAVARTLAIVGEPVAKGRARTVAGAFTMMEAQLAGTVRYGEVALPITMVRWPGAFDSGQLGSKGLAGQTLRIDYRTHRVSIRPEPTAPVCPAA